MRTERKLLETDKANFSRELEFENKGQTVRKGLGNLRTRSKPFEREKRIWQQGANRSKETENLRTRRKLLERVRNLRTGSKPLKRE